MAKASESLFGSVTCLPGCSTLYRLRTPDAYKLLLISNQPIHHHSENCVDILHMKNLLHLGEDRYLITLVLKNFPLFKPSSSGMLMRTPWLMTESFCCLNVAAGSTRYFTISRNSSPWSSFAASAVSQHFSLSSVWFRRSHCFICKFYLSCQSGTGWPVKANPSPGYCLL